MMFEITPKPGMSEEAYLWYLGQAKDNGIYEGSWSDISDLMNRFYRDGEETYRTESAYRKRYNNAKDFAEAGIFKFGDMSEDLQEQLQTIKKEKQKLADERSALNKKLRDTARFEENLAILKEKIEENGRTTLPSHYQDRENSDNDLIICLSDIHLGLDVKNSFGEYNSDIAEKYMENYLQKIDDIRGKNASQDCYVLLIGDLISGRIHPTIQLENRENLIEQVQKVSELVANFLYALSARFKKVNVISVSGNHSRLGLKDEVLRNERADDFVVWYCKAKLSHIENINYLENLDPTIGCFEVRGKKYLVSHGDFDPYSEAGLSKLVLFTGIMPAAIFCGHKHHCAFEDVSNVKYIMSGSFCGACGDYEISKRLKGDPSQAVCVATEDGIESFYPVKLNK